MLQGVRQVSFHRRVPEEMAITSVEWDFSNTYANCPNR